MYDPSSTAYTKTMSKSSSVPKKSKKKKKETKRKRLSLMCALRCIPIFASLFSSGSLKKIWPWLLHLSVIMHDRKFCGDLKLTFTPSESKKLLNGWYENVWEYPRTILTKSKKIHHQGLESALSRIERAASISVAGGPGIDKELFCWRDD